MLTLVTSNPAKYAPFKQDLDRLRICIERPHAPLPELQSLSFAENLAAKARAAAAMFGRPVLVDDAGVVLEEYAPFPGPLTSTVIKSLGIPGLQRLLAGASNRARMECHLGCWMDERLRSWNGQIEGRIDFTHRPRDGRMILSDLFVPDEQAEHGRLAHRARALASLKGAAFELHLQAAQASAPQIIPCPVATGYECPFCAEFDQDGPSIFQEMMGDRLVSRIVYEDEHFIVMPPLGEFMEGGLLVLTRAHVLSLAHLEDALLGHLERLLKAIGGAVQKRWGVAPLVFEHGPAPQWGKGVCCVDHAHLNVFPAVVQVYPHLAERMSFPIGALSELSQLRHAEFGYLLVQENDGTRLAYDGKDVPTQLVRRIICDAIGLPERWHWRDYPGASELVATFNAVNGQIHL